MTQSSQINFADIDIEQLVSYEGYEYKITNGRQGLQINVKTCPSCHSEEYKVYLNADSGLGNCFKCSETFNAFKFMKLARGIAVNRDVFAYAKNVFGNVKKRPRPKVYTDIKVNKDWVLPLNRKIELDSDLPEYLIQRNIDAKLAKRFDLRVCEAGFYKYTDLMERTKSVDFSNRIIIPIYDIDGNPATFQGRDITGTSEKKYLFPNMLPGTARYIYNADYVKKNKKKKVILNEGVFDVFATTKAIETDIAFMDWAACGTFGKHFSIQEDTYIANDQLADLAALKALGVEEFVIMWDGEPKARIAALEAAIRLRGYGFNVTVALGLPDGCDPAESTVEQIIGALNARVVPSKLQLIRHRLK